MPIRARLEDMDLTLEQAAADLYATPWKAFRRVTLPLLMPGISAGAALAFIVSFDDFTITQLVAGPGQTTLPLYIWDQHAAAVDAGDQRHEHNSFGGFDHLRDTILPHRAQASQLRNDRSQPRTSKSGRKNDEICVVLGWREPPP